MEPKISDKKDDSFVCQLEDLLAYGSSFVDTKLDGLQSKVKEGLLHFYLKLSSLFFGSVTLIIAISFLIYGISIGAGKALGGEMWIGFVLTGGALILGYLFLTSFMAVQLKKKNLKVRVIQYQNDLNKRRKTGFDTRPDSLSIIKNFASESDFLNWKADAARVAFFEKSEALKKIVRESLTVKNIAENFPLETTGVAAVAGFVVGDNLSSQSSVRVADEGQTSKTKSDLSNDMNAIKMAFITMLIAVTEDVLKETVIPAVKDKLNSHEKNNTNHLTTH